MKRQTVLVISDVHLGGAADFQMCSPAGRALLKDFLFWVARRASSERMHLVVNGDLVDFLAEAPFEALTSDDGAAERKLAAIVKSTQEVWDGFKAVTATGTRLTVLLGNHDLELTLPLANARLRDALGPGHVGLLLDGQALNLGDVLIEHGNRCDAWNLVDYDALRALRSDLSRKEVPPECRTPPGSQLVVEVMNHVKHELRFVDLLKPETDAVLPLLAALASISKAQLWRAINCYREARRVRFGPGQRPEDRSQIGGLDEGAQEPMPPGAALALDMLSRDTDVADGQIGAADQLDFFQLWRAGRDKNDNRKLLGRLYEALRHRLANQNEALRIDHEQPEYLLGANHSVTRGFKAVVYGHTHLAKRMVIDKQAWYLNTGTWADVMRLPPAVVQDNQLLALGELDAFVADLQANRLDAWRRPRPTFASFELEFDELEPGGPSPQGRLVADPQVFSYALGGVCTPLSDALFVTP